jgi:flagellar FliL protein
MRATDSSQSGLIMEHLFFSLLRRLIQAALIIAVFPVFASGGGGGGGGGPEPLQFTVNIGNSTSVMRFLQVTMVFELGSPEVGVHLAALKPKAQHQIILRLTSEEVANLQTTKGKQALQENIAADLNKLLGETSKHGVKEVLFTSFIIQ